MPEPIRRRPARPTIMKLDVDKVMHTVGDELRTSKVAREKFAEDPVAFLAERGVQVPAEVRGILVRGAASIEQVMTRPHDAVAAIAVA